jgi:lysophospholipid acyltransferase (LPLAT)-like uncharacterized protein
MGYQGFSHKLELAKQFAKAKVSKAGPLSEAEKAHRKQLAKARDEKLTAENLAQRALVESRRI